MRSMLRLTALPVVVCSFLAACGGGTSGGGTSDHEGQVDVYAARVQPILDARCGGAACHSTARGGYLLDGVPYAALLSQGAVIPGDPEGSPLYASMAAGRMTFKGPTSAEMELIEDWIGEGAPQYGDPGELPEPEPPPAPVGVDVCANYCHGVQRAEWLTGPHGNLHAVGPSGQPLHLGLGAAGFPSYGYEGLGILPTCTLACHDPLGDGARLTRGLTGDEPRPVVGCESCHGGGSRHADAPLTQPPLPLPDGAQCTACHQVVDSVHGEQSAAAWSGGAVGAGTFAGDRVTYDTHRDDPATPDVVEGYVVALQGARPCGGCHRLHAAGLSIQTQWAGSAHAGGLLDAKRRAAATEGQAAVLTAGVGEEAAAWTHYDWDHTFRAGGAADRADCQRCHTATGLKNFLSARASQNDQDPTNDVVYDPAANDFSHLEGWRLHNDADGATVASGQNELLYCWGCHEDSAGGLRNPGAMVADYKFRAGDGAVSNAAFPDVGASNTCITCHSGRESGASVAAVTDFADVSFVNSHYIAAAGLMYAKVGYTNFVDPGTVIGVSTYGKSLTSTEDGGALGSTHRKLGTSAINGDGHNRDFFVPGNLDSGGPCVTCHMPKKSGAASHTWEIDGDAFDQVCGKCHRAEGDTPLTNENFSELLVEEQAVPFQDALALARATLASRFGIEYDPTTHPYFFPAGTEHVRANAVRDWTLGGTVDGERLMGACFNIHVLAREPAAYVHARTYGRRLLYDTIDWLDDETIDLSVSATAVTWDPVKYAAAAKAADASTTESMKYLKGYSRSTGEWNAVERP